MVATTGSSQPCGDPQPDVTVLLGLPRLSPDITIRIVLDDLTVGGGHSHFGGIELIGRRLEASDIDWDIRFRVPPCAAKPKTWHL